MIAKVKNFISEVIVEFKNVSWSTRKEVIDATWIVIISTALLGIFIAVVDLGLSFALSKIIG